MIRKKRRSRSIWGIYPFYLSCGTLFIMGNIYILVSGFSQTFSAVEQSENSSHESLNQQIRHEVFWDSNPNLRLHGKKGKEILSDVPVNALAAFGYRMDGTNDLSEISETRMISSIVLKSDTRLRKLMENHIDTKLKSNENQPIKIKRRVYGNTGRKQRTKGYQFATSLKSSQHSFIDNSGNPLNSEYLIIDPSQKGIVGVQLGHHRNQTDKNSDKIRRNKDVIDIPVAELRQLLGQRSQCEMVEKLTDREFIGSGWTKTVHRALLLGKGGEKDKPAAIKTVDMSGHDVTNCMREYGDIQYCYNKASQKLLKEVLLLSSFHSPHIIKVIGYCIPRKPYDGAAGGLVSMVTELGETIDLIKLLQMSWEERLRVSYGITKLLNYLAESPFGTVSLNDFRRQQFVLVNNDIVLTDVDDMGIGDPKCQTDANCVHYFSSANFTLGTSCRKGRCQGFNEKKNIFNAARHFTTFLLPHGAPSGLKPRINQIVHAYSNATSNTKTLIRWMNDVVDIYRSQITSDRSRDQMSKTKSYRCLNDTDLPGLHDYRCRFSAAAVGCTLSVLNQHEAEEKCDSDNECQGFVISDKRTWAGRMIVHLKNHVTSAKDRQGLVMCLKPSKGR